MRDYPTANTLVKLLRRVVSMLVSTLGADLDGHAIAVVDLIGAITLAFYAHTP